jgi:hypothetical protein
MPILSIYFNFLNTDKFSLGMRCSNFSEFYVGNLGQASYSLYGTMRLNENWLLWSELEMVQSGHFALSAAFYRIAYTGGVRFIW